LVEQRGLSDLRLTEGRPGVPAGALYSRMGPVSQVRRERNEAGDWFDRYTLPYDLTFLPSGGVPRTLIDDYQRPPDWDAAGRLWVQRSRTYAGDQGRFETRFASDLWRFQLGEAEGTALGRVRMLAVSPGGTRVLTCPEQNQWVLRDMNDRELRFATRPPEEPVYGIGAAPVFLGEDLFFVDDETLFRIHDAAVGPTAVLSGRITPFFRARTAGGRLLLETLTEIDGGQIESRALLFRTDSADPPELIPLPSRVGGPVLSPDGKRLAWLQRTAPDRALFHLIDLESRQETTGEIPMPRPQVVPPGGAAPPPVNESDPAQPVPYDPIYDLEFRPGSQEVWGFLHRQVSILRGQDDAVTHPHPFSEVDHDPPGFTAEDFFQDERDPFFSPSRAQPARQRSRFSRDGRFWTVARGDDGHLADAEHPESQDTVMLFGQNDYEPFIYEYLPGMRAAYLFTVTFQKRDLHVLDLPQRKVRKVARNVASVTVGRARAVVRLRTVTGDGEGPGDLALVDLETGDETLLARNVVDFALAPACADCDPTAPGARLVYLVHGRLPWKHDGLWEAVLP
jgi:hypothetical protein